MTPSLPAWVEKRDGRREAFDADKISESIFAATEAVGEPNAFLARELADGVLHFLVQENDANVPTTVQIAELVEKVVRELGHPKLAEAFARGPVKKDEDSHEVRGGLPHFTFSTEKAPEQVADDCLAAYSLLAVFGRDLAAAHHNELLLLSGLKDPRRLETIVVDPPTTAATGSPWRIAWAQVRDASKQAGERVVVDGAELLIAAHGPEWFEGFAAALEAYQRCAVLHMHAATPPGWASETDSGPLFRAAGPATPKSAVDVAALLDTVAVHRSHGLRIAWHLQASTIDEPSVRRTLDSVLARTDILSKLVFVFDRQRQHIRLQEGVDRKHPAVLMRVYLLLNNFLNLPEIGGDATRMLAKLPSLLRMAVSAGVQKRNYLRRHCSELTRGFLLERARLIIEPSWLFDVVGTVTGALPAQSKLALDFARQILQILREAADCESRAAGLDVVLAETGGVSTTEFARANADAAAQQAAASALLETVHDGCFRVHGRQLTMETTWQYLRWAAKTAHIPRIRFVPLPDQED